MVRVSAGRGERREGGAHASVPLGPVRAGQRCQRCGEGRGRTFWRRASCEEDASRTVAGGAL